MNRLSETQRAYLAGLVDGEGCIVITKMFPKRRKGKFYHVLYVKVSQYNKQFLDYWQRETGLGNVHHAGGKNPKRKNDFQWQLGAAQAEELLKSVFDFLMIKKEQAQIALDFRNHKKARYRLTNQEIQNREAYRVALREIKKIPCPTFTPPDK